MTCTLPLGYRLHIQSIALAFLVWLVGRFARQWPLLLLTPVPPQVETLLLFTPFTLVHTLLLLLLLTPLVTQIETRSLP